MRYLIAALLLLHGLIHLMGFAKAFHYGEWSQLKKAISKPAGLVWLFCALAFISTAVLFLFKEPHWWWLALVAMIVSQGLIISCWSDAKFGTVVHLILLLPILNALPTSFTSRFHAAARPRLMHHEAMPVVTEADLGHLPASVQKYLRLCGVVGKPQVQNFRAVFQGQFRKSLEGPWMNFHSEQYNFFYPAERLFLMDASMRGLPFQGLHLFLGDSATMQIKVASLFQVVDAKGPKMNQGETVTLFNDMCLMAPATLIDRQRIRWDDAGPLRAKAFVTHRGITIEAALRFNEAGELMDFISEDRLMSEDGKTYTSLPWSTPVKAYRSFPDRRVASYAEVVWHTPSGEFCYGKFNLVEIDYNLTALR